MARKLYSNDMETTPYWFIIMALSLLGFFLIRFWYMVDEIRRDVKKMLISEAENNQIIRNLKEDIIEFKHLLQEHEKSINFLKRELERMKNGLGHH